MSSTDNVFDYDNTANVLSTQPPPAHHKHRSEDPIATGGPDYSADVTNDSQIWKGKNERRFGAGTDTRVVMGGGQHAGNTAPATNFDEGDAGDDRNAFTEDRAMNVKPSGAGGVAIDGRDDLPEGKASASDKLIGKVQKVTGKVLHKPEMHEKGELRESGGKEAAAGRARAPHD